MKINQTILYLVSGLLILPIAFILLFVQGGFLPSLVAIFFLIMSISFLFISTTRIFTQELLKKTWFWAIVLGGILVLIGMIFFYV